MGKDWLRVYAKETLLLSLDDGKINKKNNSKNTKKERHYGECGGNGENDFTRGNDKGRT